MVALKLNAVFMHAPSTGRSLTFGMPCLKLNPWLTLQASKTLPPPTALLQLCEPM